METMQVPLRDVKTHPALQARDPTLLKHREQARQEEQSELHVHDMAELLKADPQAELVALQVAEVDGTLYVVDGHHRLRAYKRAKRETVPARVQAMTWKEASHASKLANIAFTKLEMRPAQKRNALWHHLDAVTQRGLLRPKESQVLLAGRFGVHRDTVRNMLRRLPEVEPEEFPPEQRDAITGWPHWKHVTQTRSGMYQAMDPDVRREWREDRFLKRLARVIDKEDPEIVRGALERWTAGAPDEDQRLHRRALEVAVWAESDEAGEVF
jgi:ParB-like chromosome segregation protein Spo0J